MLPAGTRVGPYEVVSWLGAGGMGEVYRARDTTLDREVALKTLPAELAQQPDRLARLKQEARILASLNHAGIATLHGLEQSDGGVPVLGTAPYMSPEQARGQDADRRTDIWAFGCVLFEMLTGKRAFAGATFSDTVAAILDRDPDWSALPPDAPPTLIRLLRRCLQKEK